MKTYNAYPFGTPGPEEYRNVYLVGPPATYKTGNPGVVVSVENPGQKTGFYFTYYDVGSYERPPQPGEEVNDWLESTGARTQMSSFSGRPEGLVTALTVEVCPPLRTTEEFAGAAAIVGNQFAALRADPLASVEIARKFVDAGIPFEDLDVRVGTINCSS